MRGNGDILITLELVWLILVDIYILVALLVDDHPNIVQWTQLLIILAYVGTIKPNSSFSGNPLVNAPSLVFGWMPHVD